MIYRCFQNELVCQIASKEVFYKRRIRVKCGPLLFVRGLSVLLVNHSFSTYAKYSEKTNILYPLIRKRTCACQGVRKVNFFGELGVHTKWMIPNSTESVEHVQRYQVKTPLWCFYSKLSRNSRSNLVKKRLQHSCFPVNIAEFLRTACFIEHLQWLLPKPNNKYFYWKFWTCTFMFFRG